MNTTLKIKSRLNSTRVKRRWTTRKSGITLISRWSTFTLTTCKRNLFISGHQCYAGMSWRCRTRYGTRLASALIYSSSYLWHMSSRKVTAGPREQSISIISLSTTNCKLKSAYATTFGQPWLMWVASMTDYI